MKLIEACRMGMICGLKTVDECVTNIDIHASMFYPYEKIPAELTELYEELEQYEEGLLSIDLEALKEEADKELNEYFDQDMKNRPWIYDEAIPEPKEELTLFDFSCEELNNLYTQEKY